MVSLWETGENLGCAVLMKLRLKVCRREGSRWWYGPGEFEYLDFSHYNSAGHLSEGVVDRIEMTCGGYHAVVTTMEGRRYLAYSTGHKIVPVAFEQIHT